MLVLAGHSRTQEFSSTSLICTEDRHHVFLQSVRAASVVLLLEITPPSDTPGNQCAMCAHLSAQADVH